MKKFIGLLLLLNFHSYSGTLTDPVERKKQDALFTQVQSALNVLKSDKLSSLDQEELKELTLAEIIDVAKQSQESSVSIADLLGFTDPPSINDDDDKD